MSGIQTQQIGFLQVVASQFTPHVLAHPETKFADLALPLALEVHADLVHSLNDESALQVGSPMKEQGTVGPLLMDPLRCR